MTGWSENMPRNLAYRRNINMNIERITEARSMFVMNGGFDAISVKNKLAMSLMDRDVQYVHFLEEPGLFKMLLMYEVVEIEREGN